MAPAHSISPFFWDTLSTATHKKYTLYRDEDIVQFLNSHVLVYFYCFIIIFLCEKECCFLDFGLIMNDINAVHQII